ncbi:hypothetical protein ACQ4PT_054943 [Festuca glaucescens]
MADSNDPITKDVTMGRHSSDPCSSRSVQPKLSRPNKADGPIEDDDPFGIAELVDDMAYRVWKCGHCLSMSHEKEKCTNNIRSHFCFRYGHVRKDCLAAKNKKIWIPKLVSSGQTCLDSRTGPQLDSIVVPTSQVSFAIAPPSPIPIHPPPSFSSALLRTPMAMANFELDPTRWVPLGHQIIDGGSTRLPRTFYTPSVTPPRRHDNICTAIMMPPPPPAEEEAWREQVPLFIIQQLQHAVDDVQPCLFGLGFYRLRSPAARFALVDHGPYEVALDVFVRFVNHDDRDNHRAVQGYRKGWLMFLGIHLDYRNEYDIANVEASFGKYHYWHHEDEVLERTLVYASFPSLALVPRDVVFGRYDIFPPDEDQMPANGNPHPMLGYMQHDDNVFVFPQFPELGWNEQIPPQPQVQDDNFIQPEPQVEELIVQQVHQVQVQEIQEPAVEEQVVSSIVNGSGQILFMDIMGLRSLKLVWAEFSLRATPSKKRKVQRKQDQVGDQHVKDISKKKSSKGAPGRKKSASDKECNIPPTPISVMQKVGLALGIDAHDLSKEKFMATPDDKVAPDVSND